MQMAVVRLPLVKDIAKFKNELLEQYRIEVPCTEWNNHHFIRISVQAYNSAADLETLTYALTKLLNKHRLKI